MSTLVLGIGAGPKKRPTPPPPIGGGKARGMETILPARAEKKAAPVAEVDVPAPPKEKPAGGEGVIQPEAVCYRSEMETCGNCEFNDGGNCSRLSIPVSDGDGCNLFSDKGTGADADEAAEGFEGPEGSDEDR